MESLINEAWQLYHRAWTNPVVVSPSIPILYFGDYERYRDSPTKVITVALNPSRKEFPDEDRFLRFPCAGAVYPGIMDSHGIDDYANALKDYFRVKPYTSWFGWFEEVLLGMNASYWDGQTSNALHTDICTPLATDPTWSGLGSERAQFEADGIELWHRLVDVLSPDVIVISIAKAYRDRIRFAQPDAWHHLHQLHRDTPEKKPYIALCQRVTLPNGHRTLLVFGQAAQQPFATLTKLARQEIGRAVTGQLSG